METIETNEVEVRIVRVEQGVAILSVVLKRDEQPVYMFEEQKIPVGGSLQIKGVKGQATIDSTEFFDI